MANPFYVSPLAGFDVAGGLQDTIQAIQAQSAQEKAAQQAEQTKAQAVQVLNSGDPNQISQFMLENPKYSQALEASLGFRNEATKENMQSSMRDILAGRDPETVIKERAQFVVDQGGDPSDTLAELEAYRDDPESFLQQNELSFAMLDPDSYKSFKEAKDKTVFEQGAGDMSGYAFNPSTGEYSIDPNLKQALDAAKEKEKEKGEVDVKTRDSINKTLTNLTDDAVSIRNTAEDLDRLSGISSGPAQIAMVFKFMKALDPGSVVREGEFATAQNSAGVPDAIANTYNRLVSGERLTDAQMMEFVNTAKTLANSAIDAAGSEVGGYLGTFEETLPKSFKEKLTNRLPQRFELKKRISLDEARKKLEGL